MKRLLAISLLASAAILHSCTPAAQKLIIDSPNSKVQVTLEAVDESIVYSVTHAGEVVIEKSMLGIEFQNPERSSSLAWAGVSEVKPVNFDYVLYQGKRLENSYSGNEGKVYLKGDSGFELNIKVRVANDGLAIKYVFPGKKDSLIVIEKELTTIKFPEGTRSWLQPMSVAKSGWNRTNPSYEENYFVNIPTGTASPTAAGWVYPALFQIDEHWVHITEAGLKANFCGSKLAQHSPGNEYHIAYPQAEEKIFDGPLNPESTLPWESPWRVITIGSLQTIIESNHGNAFAEPAIDMDTSFIKPGMASWSWALLKDPSITYDIQKEFIDYAAEMNWPYCLIDVNWDTTIGYDKIEELSNYARSKDVGVILWYNSAGDWNDVTFHPKDKILTSESRAKEFSRLNDMGIAGVKIDFFGGDGQSVIEYYHDILTDAAQHKLLVNFHGTTLPRGWHRTYPNLMTMESVKGFEFITFEQANADLGPEHCTILPFTRNAFDPMDFTPMNLTSIPNIERRSSAAFELALPVLFLSGIQHIAETAKGMATMPEYIRKYLRDIPTDWDDSKFLAGYPGKYVVVARKKGNTWFISGINAKDEVVELDLDLSFIENESGFIIQDGKSAAFNQKSLDLGESAQIQVSIAAKGGFVAKF